ncbi:hypothetical protein PTKIN_Ptkin02bG0160200 [Pterospermum kingtungense]
MPPGRNKRNATLSRPVANPTRQDQPKSNPRVENLRSIPNESMNNQGLVSIPSGNENGDTLPPQSSIQTSNLLNRLGEAMPTESSHNEAMATTKRGRGLARGFEIKKRMKEGGKIQGVIIENGMHLPDQSKANMSNRAKMGIPHTSRSKSFCQRIYELEQMKIVQNKANENGTELTGRQILEKVLKSKSGYVCGLGYGAKPNSSGESELESLLDAERVENEKRTEELTTQLQSHNKKILDQQATINQLMESQNALQISHHLGPEKHVNKGTNSEDADDLSPIEEVRLTVTNTDDRTLPIWTFRMWFLGLLSCALLSFLNQFFAYRTEPLVITQITVQVAAFPIGQFMAAVLPRTKFKLPGLGSRKFSVNPGPFSMKEHVLGYGWAGLLRKYVVEPAHMWWPNTLAQVLLFSFSWYLVPGHLFPTLSSISWVCWIFSNSVTAQAQQIGSGMRELGLGAFTLDWTVVASFLFSSFSVSMFLWAIREAKHVLRSHLWIWFCHHCIDTDTCGPLLWKVQMPWWGLLFASAMAFLFTLPISIITATTNQTPGLNIITEYVMGLIYPGRPIANVCFKTYGYMSKGQAVSFLNDFKLGHYMKIPPRSHVLSSVAWWLLESIENVFQDDLLPADSPWTCPGGRVFFDASVIWGLVSPKRIFVSLGNYSVMNWFFIGALGPVIVWLLHKTFPKQSLDSPN